MPTSAGECSRCSTLTLELERMQSQRDDHERAARALQKKVHAQAHGLSTAAATIAQLQEQLATEQNTLVAEMGKANRLSNSITDQMYADCQVNICKHIVVKFITSTMLPLGAAPAVRAALGGGAG